MILSCNSIKTADNNLIAFVKSPTNCLCGLLNCVQNQSTICIMNTMDWTQQTAKLAVLKPTPWKIPTVFVTFGQHNSRHSKAKTQEKGAKNYCHGRFFSGPPKILQNPKTKHTKPPDVCVTSHCSLFIIQKHIRTEQMVYQHERQI